MWISLFRAKNQGSLLLKSGIPHQNHTKTIQKPLPDPGVHVFLYIMRRFPVDRKTVISGTVSEAGAIAV